MFALDLVYLLFPLNGKTNEVLICAAREGPQLILHVHIYHPGGMSDFDVIHLNK